MKSTNGEKGLYTAEQTVELVRSDLNHRLRMAGVWHVPRGEVVVAQAARAWADEILKGSTA